MVQEWYVIHALVDAQEASVLSALEPRVRPTTLKNCVVACGCLNLFILCSSIRLYMYSI